MMEVRPGMEVRVGTQNTAMFLPVTIPPESRQTLVSAGVDYRKLIENCLSGIMILGQNRQRINKDELRDAIYIRQRRQHHTVTTAVLDHANHYLHKYMGMRLYTNDQKVYLLVNSTTIPNHCRKELSEKDCEELSVIFLVLMEIFSSPDENSTETQIRETLGTLDLTEDKLKSHIALLVKRQYIVLEKNDNFQREEKHYKWGPRAVAEVDPDKFMQSFLDLAESGSADDWPDQKRRIELLKSVKNRRIPMANQANS